ncbi:MAG: LysM peptidoglycan-binding domain-containing protein [Candidatus Marinimicrobia bacterium]|nr:LysM peptidoglycan-binding domain-containing protein [Candidatus Neomarinimicrobiota bacterium]
MKHVLPLLAIVLSVFMLVGCGNKEVVNDTPEPVVEETPIVEETPVVEVAPVVETAVVEEAVEEILPEEVIEPLEEDVWVKYMIQPNDYLTKIALQEYGVVTMWREIWNWNIEVIGDDPDLIYPFEELSLKKDAADVEEVAVCEYEAYTVQEGESLWCISKKLYGNSYAWIVLLRDNMDTLGNDYNSITAGMVLRVRTEL